MRVLNDEKGQTTVLVVLSMIVLLGFTALAVDIGALFHARRNLQTVADAAATAGALDYYRNGLGNASSITYARTAAEKSIEANGITTAGYSDTCPVVASGGVPQACIAIPPSSGVHIAPGFVEVQITQPNPAVFMRAFGFGNLNVNVRGVGGIYTGQSCIWVKNNLNIQGNAGICGIDPSNPSAWTGNCASGLTCPLTGKMACGIYAGGSITGSGGGGGSNCIASNYVATAGSVGVNLNPSPAVANVTETVPDFLTKQPPAPSGCQLPTASSPGVSAFSTYTSHGVNIVEVHYANTTLSAGCIGWDTVPGNTDMLVYLDNNVVMADGMHTFNLGNTTIGSGSNAMTGGTLTLGSNVTNASIPTDFSSSYSGVTMVINTGNFDVESTSTGINLYAANGVYDTTSGQTSDSNGILLWEPSSNTATNPGIRIQWGSATGNFYGYIVASGATLDMQDQGGFGIVTGLYVGNMTVNSQLGVASYNTTVAGAPGKQIALVE